MVFFGAVGSSVESFPRPKFTLNRKSIKRFKWLQEKSSYRESVEEIVSVIITTKFVHGKCTLEYQSSMELKTPLIAIVRKRWGDL